jgi:foldase protein PrsA
MNTKKMVAILLALILIFSLTACGNGEKAEDKLLARVGDIEIGQGQLDQYTYLYAFLQGLDLDAVDEETLASVKTMILEDYISLKIMETYFAGDETVLPDGFEAELDQFVQTVNADETSSAFMKKHEISDEFLKEFYTSQYYSAAFFEELSATVPAVTDEEVEAYYAANPAQFKIDEVTAKHILVEDQDLAEELLAQLKAGADFGELAKENSIDGSAVQGGDLGTFGRNAMVAEFETAAFALEPGELSDVVETEFGYHIILVTEKNQGTESFEEAQAAIKSTLENQALSEVYTKKIDELGEQYGVEYID